MFVVCMAWHLFASGYVTHMSPWPRALKASLRGECLAVVPRAIVQADHALRSVLLFTDPLPAYSAVHMLRFQRQWLAGISCGKNAAAGPWNVATWTCNAIAERNIRCYSKAKAAMIRTLALEEHNRTETILEQFDSKRREILHSRYRTFACVLKV